MIVFEICNTKHKRRLQIDSVKGILSFKNVNSLNKKKKIQPELAPNNFKKIQSVPVG